MSRTSIIALLIFGAILGYFLSFGAETTRKLQASIYQMLAPFFTTGSGLQKQITSVRTGLKSLEELGKENASLRVDNRQLRATNSALRDVEHEVNRLRHALNYRERSVFKLIPAEIVTRDASTWWHTVTINRGKEDHIETDMPVVTDEGLVGKTTTVSNTISIVLLVTDENCKVAASVEGTREQGIVLGERVSGGLTPPLDWMYHAHIYIAPVLVFYGAMALPFPLMLALALFAGVLLDALTVQVIGSKVEISLGWSILLYAVLAGIMHGLRPLFIRGRWEVHCVLTGLCTSAIILAQYLMITFRRGSLFFTREVWWQIGGPGLMAMLMAPVIFWMLNWVARVTRYPYLPERSFE